MPSTSSLIIKRARFPTLTGRSRVLACHPLTHQADSHITLHPIFEIYTNSKHGIWVVSPKATFTTSSGAEKNPHRPTKVFWFCLHSLHSHSRERRMASQENLFDVFGDSLSSKLCSQGAVDRTELPLCVLRSAICTTWWWRLLYMRPLTLPSLHAIDYCVSGQNLILGKAYHVRQRACVQSCTIQVSECQNRIVIEGVNVGSRDLPNSSSNEGVLCALTEKLHRAQREVQECQRQNESRTKKGKGWSLRVTENRISALSVGWCCGAKDKPLPTLIKHRVIQDLQCYHSAIVCFHAMICSKKVYSDIWTCQAHNGVLCFAHFKSEMYVFQNIKSWYLT